VLLSGSTAKRDMASSNLMMAERTYSFTSAL